MSDGPSPSLSGAVDHLIAAACLIAIAPPAWRASPDATFADLRAMLRRKWPAARLPELAR